MVDSNADTLLKSKATPQNKETIEENPYNQKKSWHEGTDKPFKSSDELYFEEPSEKNKLFKSNDVNEAEQPDNVEVENLETVKDTPYKKPDYKKRYDDLKRHYDSKLNEFKSREQELLEEATKNRTDYQAPKTEEELEQFKQQYPDVYEVVETVAHLQSESKAKVLEERLSKLQDILILMILETVMIFIHGQKNSHRLFKIGYTRMLMMPI